MADEYEEKRYSWIEKKKDQVLFKQDVRDGIFELDHERALRQQEELKGEDPLIVARQNVEKQLPPGFNFVNRGKLLASGEYTYKAGKKTKKVSRKVKEKSSMKAVVDGLTKLDDLLAQKIDLKKADQLQAAFLDVCQACDTYINKKNPYSAEGKARMQMVQDFYKQVSWESMRFAEYVKELEKSKEDMTGKNWLDVLRHVRTEVYTDGEDGVKIEMGGDGTSEVYVIEKDGEKKYFKEEEKVPEYNLQSLTLKKLAKYSGAEPEGKTKKDKEKNQAVKERRKDYIAGAYTALTGHFAKKGTREDDFRHEINTKEELYNLLKKLQPETYIEKAKGKYKATTEERKEDLRFATNFFFAIRKQLSLSHMATGTALIEKNETLMKRNAATSRLAGILGIQDIIVGTKMTDVNIGGQTKRGVMMDEAKGESIALFYLKNREKNPGIKMRYSTDAVRQILTLHVFDLLCGQIDRHDANYLGNIKKKKDGSFEVENIKGIDNDLSFGQILYSDVFSSGKRGWNKIKNVENEDGFRIPAIDVDFANQILGLSPKTIDYQMCDLLSKDERKCLIDRLVGLQTAIRRAKKDELNRGIKGNKSRFVKGKEGWENKIKQFETAVEMAPEKCGDIADFSYMFLEFLGDIGAKKKQYQNYGK